MRFKFQVLQISFIIFSIFFLILTYFFLATNFFKVSEKILTERKIDIFENLNNIILAYSKLSLYYATTLNLREESHSWIHNGFNPLDFNYLKECKENVTRYFLNSYLSKFQVFLPVEIKISRTDKCFWNITERDVFDGKHDEGHFYTNCSEIQIIIYTNETISRDVAEIKNYISNNRYWYLYRKIYEWAKENGDKFANCVCYLVSSCANCKQIEKCYEGLFEALKEKFIEDKYVRCKEITSEPCCYQEFGEPCIDIKACIGWTKNICYLSKDYECPKIDDNIQMVQVIKKVASSNSNLFVYLTCKWLENRMETNKIYECEDYKYYESTPSGPDKIVFRIGVFAGFRNYKACIKFVKCFYSGNNAICKNCENNECESCLLPFVYCEENPCYNPPEYMECRNCRVNNCENEKCNVIECEKCLNKDERCEDP